MNCEKFVQQLDDYLDGDLAAAESGALTAHAAACPACHAILEQSRQLQMRVASLPREYRPRRDLWPAIAQRLEPATARSTLTGQPWLRAVAATVALVAVFAGGMLADRVLRESNESLQPRMARQETGNVGLPDAQEARRFLPASHVELIEGGSGHNAGIGKGTEQELLQNLLLVNLAIRKVEAAASEDPSNANLRELLSSLYAQEHRILSQAERLRVAGQAPTRTGI